MLGATTTGKDPTTKLHVYTPDGVLVRYPLQPPTPPHTDVPPTPFQPTQVQNLPQPATQVQNLPDVPPTPFQPTQVQTLPDAPPTQAQTLPDVPPTPFQPTQSLNPTPTNPSSTKCPISNPSSTKCPSQTQALPNVPPLQQTHSQTQALPDVPTLKPKLYQMFPHSSKPTLKPNPLQLTHSEAQAFNHTLITKHGKGSYDKVIKFDMLRLSIKESSKSSTLVKEHDTLLAELQRAVQAEKIDIMKQIKTIEMQHFKHSPTPETFYIPRTDAPVLTNYLLHGMYNSK